MPFAYCLGCVWDKKNLKNPNHIIEPQFAIISLNSKYLFIVIIPKGKNTVLFCFLPRVLRCVTYEIRNI